jgi:hypothetical protein
MPAFPRYVSASCDKSQFTEPVIPHGNCVAGRAIHRPPARAAYWRLLEPRLRSRDSRHPSYRVAAGAARLVRPLVSLTVIPATYPVPRGTGERTFQCPVSDQQGTRDLRDRFQLPLLDPGGDEVAEPSANPGLQSERYWALLYPDNNSGRTPPHLWRPVGLVKADLLSDDQDHSQDRSGAVRRIGGARPKLLAGIAERRATDLNP